MTPKEHPTEEKVSPDTANLRIAVAESVLNGRGASAVLEARANPAKG